MHHGLDLLKILLFLLPLRVLRVLLVHFAVRLSGLGVTANIPASTSQLESTS